MKKRVKENSLSLFTEMTTRKEKMFSGVEITGLHLLKRTSQYLIGIESWSHCVGNFKIKIKNFVDEFNIPLIEDQKTIDFLNEHAWKKWEEREDNQDPDTVSKKEFINKLFPGKKQYYFYELESLLSLWTNGSLLMYDKEGNIKPKTENNLRNIDYYNYKYLGMKDFGPPHVDILFKKYLEIKNDEKKKTEAYKKYRAAHDKYIRENLDLSDVFKIIGENIVVCPFVFSPTSLGSCDGEILFLNTPEAVFTSIVRHF